MTGGKAQSRKEPCPELSFEDRLRRVEDIVSELERGGGTLESALALFEEGIGHMRALTAELEKAQSRVDRLVAVEGETVLVPLEAGRQGEDEE